MIPLKPPFRIATETDAAELAELVNIAGEGLPLHMWQGMAAAGQDPWEVGRQRQIEKAESGQIVVAEAEGRAVASLTGYMVGPEPEAIGSDFPALFRPLQELENEALNSWYVNVLACFPERRGQGLGSRFLKIADEIAESEGLRRLSLIVAGDNEAAIRLYKRCGYRMTSSRSCVREGWKTTTEKWVLMIKDLPN